MSKEDKEFKKQQQIAEAIAKIQGAREKFERLAERYNEWIDKAAELGEDAYSDRLIEDKVGIEELVRNFEALETRIVQGAVTAESFSILKDVPKAIKACDSLLHATPDLKKLGKQMGAFESALDKARVSFKDMRQEMAGSKNSVYSDLFGSKKATDPNVKSKIEAEKKAREARLTAKLEKSGSAPVASEVNAGATKGLVDIDDLTRMIDEENKKK